MLLNLFNLEISFISNGNVIKPNGSIKYGGNNSEVDIPSIKKYIKINFLIFVFLQI